MISTTLDALVVYGCCTVPNCQSVNVCILPKTQRAVHLIVEKRFSFIHQMVYISQMCAAVRI